MPHVKVQLLVGLLVLGGLGATVLPGHGAEAATDPALQPWVVVAVVDSGINPYHDAFAAPDLTDHPSTYIDGYPASAQALTLTLDAPDHQSAVAADASVWSGVTKGSLRWVPGTKIIGAIDLGDAYPPSPSNSDPTPILDDHGHGTGVAGVVAGNTDGTCGRCLLVVVEDPAGLAWATRQPWIDIVVNSWGTAGNIGVPFPDERAPAYTLQYATREAAECGQTILFATGNGVDGTFLAPEQTYLSNEQGPSWVVRVGGYTQNGEGESVSMWGTGKPPTLLGQATGLQAPSHRSLSDNRYFSGTSGAAPWAAGFFARTLLEARILLDDLTEARATPCTGAGQVVAEGTPVGTGPLADGALNRSELWEVVFTSARPTTHRGVQLSPLVVSVDELAPFSEGWGLVDRTTVLDAIAALNDGAPQRPDRAFWMARDEGLRDIIWGPWDRDGDGTRERALFVRSPILDLLA